MRITNLNGFHVIFLEFNTTSPRDVEMTAVTTSSMTISWKEPQTIASNITYYSICYRKSLIQACRTKIVESQTRSAILENLDSSTNYKIRVRAHTSIGPGPYSMDISQNTKSKFRQRKFFQGIFKVAYFQGIFKVIYNTKYKYITYYINSRLSE